MTGNPCRATRIVLLRAPLLLVVLLGATAAARSAQACSCQPGAFVLWPKAGATVDRGTAFLMFSNEARSPEVVVRGPGDERIAVRIEATLASAACFNNIFIVKPEAPLAASQRYVLSFEQHRGQPLVELPFQTTAVMGRPVPDDSVKAHLLASHVAGARLLELFVDAASESPLLVHARGAPNDVSVWLSAGELEGVLPLGDVPCAKADVYDVTGTRVQQIDLCEPDRCQRLDSVGSSSCNENPGSLRFRTWSDVLAGHQSGGAIACPALAGSKDVGPPSGGGCSVSRGAPSAPAPWGVALLATAAGWLRRPSRRCGPGS